MMAYTGATYFRKRQEQGLLDIEEEYEDEETDEDEDYEIEEQTELTEHPNKEAYE